MKIFQVGLICILYFIENFDFNLIIFSYIMDVVVTFQMELVHRTGNEDFLSCLELHSIFYQKF